MGFFYGFLWFFLHVAVVVVAVVGVQLLMSILVVGEDQFEKHTYLTQPKRHKEKIKCQKSRM